MSLDLLLFLIRFRLTCIWHRHISNQLQQSLHCHALNCLPEINKFMPPSHQTTLHSPLRPSLRPSNSLTLSLSPFLASLLFFSHLHSCYHSLSSFFPKVSMIGGDISFRKAKSGHDGTSHRFLQLGSLFCCLLLGLNLLLPPRHIQSQASFYGPQTILSYSESDWYPGDKVANVQK